MLYVNIIVHYTCDWVFMVTFEVVFQLIYQSTNMIKYK